ncbi:hypothetical protein FQA39_LY08267 [Lamprigera yunnana]|nr:hypothetical protein FQA39_LY08267 [Lamprigera yunnana]
MTNTFLQDVHSLYCLFNLKDNTQCSIPVFNITHDLPLCTEHARKRDNYRMFHETKPKKLRKKVKPSAMIRSQNYKCETEPIPNDLPCETETEICENDMVEEVLSLLESDGLELVSVEQVLVNQATNLLEESEISNVLNTIETEDFNDFFTVDRNGEYNEPTREETEELERALAAVDNDVKSLEKLTQSRGLLDSFLEEDTLEGSNINTILKSKKLPPVNHVNIKKKKNVQQLLGSLELDEESKKFYNIVMEGQAKETVENERRDYDDTEPVI